jgi:hypothetical protein
MIGVLNHQNELGYEEYTLNHHTLINGIFISLTRPILFFIYSVRLSLFKRVLTTQPTGGFKPPTPTHKHALIDVYH